MYIDGVQETPVGGTLTDDTIDYTTSNHSVASSNTGSVKFDGCISELYVNYDDYLDFSVEANRLLFRSAAGDPVSLGADGSTPTGSQPIIYMPEGDASSNSGYGGNYTYGGTSAVACATSP